jgi:flagellar protein FliO/FliZ
VQFLTSLFGGSENIWLTALFALGVVIVLILLVSWVLRLFSAGPARNGRGRNRRLAVVDSLVVDPKRTLLIVRRDNVEHLILTGGPADVVVESGIPHRDPETPAQTRQAPLRTRQRFPANRPAGQTQPQPVTADFLPPAAAPEPSTAGERRPARRHPGLLRPVSQQGPGAIPRLNGTEPAYGGHAAHDSDMNDDHEGVVEPHDEAEQRTQGRSD